MSTILLSIKPEYSKRIFDGTKKYEYRKHIAQKEVNKIIVYSSSPEKKVIGEVAVIGILSLKKTPLWKLTKSHSGISRKKYREYFNGCDIAYAYELGEFKKYEKPMLLSDFGLLQAPQSFVYVKIES